MLQDDILLRYATKLITTMLKKHAKKFKKLCQIWQTSKTSTAIIKEAAATFYSVQHTNVDDARV